eukprot:1157552-Pelagomonas_calceolata.AAC.3
MWSRTCTPCPGVWMREPLIYGLLLIVEGEQVSNEWQGQLAWRALRRCILLPPLCQKGLASPIFQRRLRRVPH